MKRTTISISQKLGIDFRMALAKRSKKIGRNVRPGEITERLIERWIQDPTIIEEATNGAQQ